MLLKKIGFIGLGSMGFPMAKNLLVEGYQVHITKHSNNQKSIDRIDALIALGAKLESSIVEVVKDVDLIISVLPADKEVRDVYLNKEVLNAIKTEAIILDMTSCTAGAIIDVEKYYSEKGIRVLDAPVSGGIGGAQKGTLTIFGAGDKNSFDEIEDVLNCLGDKIYYIGSLGKGKILKSINNMLNAINTVAVIEGLTVANQNGIDLEIMYDVLTNSSGNSNSLEKKFDKIRNNDYEPNFKMSLMKKDVKIAIDSGKNSNLPIAELVHNMFVNASELGDLDYTSISQIYKNKSSEKS
ncbi:MAG: NAD(P)-dependent oxidoreductase [Bacillota bacterium]|nr:NAD(P)-dependent oxidoreductase [Bacillota bacterium]